MPSPVFISAMLPWCRAAPPISCTSKCRWPIVRRAASRTTANASGSRSSSDSPLPDALPELGGLAAELVVAEVLDLGLEGVHELRDRLEVLEFAAFADVAELVEYRHAGSFRDVRESRFYRRFGSDSVGPGGARWPEPRRRDSDRLGERAQPLDQPGVLARSRPGTRSRSTASSSERLRERRRELVGRADRVARRRRSSPRAARSPGSSNETAARRPKWMSCFQPIRPYPPSTHTRIDDATRPRARRSRSRPCSSRTPRPPSPRAPCAPGTHELRRDRAGEGERHRREAVRDQAGVRVGTSGRAGPSTSSRRPCRTSTMSSRSIAARMSATIRAGASGNASSAAPRSSSSRTRSRTGGTSPRISCTYARRADRVERLADVALHARPRACSGRRPRRRVRWMCTICLSPVGFHRDGRVLDQVVPDRHHDVGPVEAEVRVVLHHEARSCPARSGGRRGTRPCRGRSWPRGCSAAR